MAKHKHSVERELSEMADLNYVIARPAIVYGLGDRQGLSMKFLGFVFCICGIHFLDIIGFSLYKYTSTFVVFFLFGIYCILIVPGKVSQ